MTNSSAPINHYWSIHHIDRLKRFKAQLFLWSEDCAVKLPNLYAKAASVIVKRKGGKENVDFDFGIIDIHTRFAVYHLVGFSNPKPKEWRRKNSFSYLFQSVFIVPPSFILELYDSNDWVCMVHIFFLASVVKEWWSTLRYMKLNYFNIKLIWMLYFRIHPCRWFPFDGFFMLFHGMMIIWTE